jgi:hypothetical protein
LPSVVRSALRLADFPGYVLMDFEPPNAGRGAKGGKAQPSKRR